MKIEKISDNKIKCILTREDLESRQIRISELAYGSEKARQLFREGLPHAPGAAGHLAHVGEPAHDLHAVVQPVAAVRVRFHMHRPLAAVLPRAAAHQTAAFPFGSGGQEQIGKGDVRPVLPLGDERGLDIEDQIQLPLVPRPDVVGNAGLKYHHRRLDDCDIYYLVDWDGQTEIRLRATGVVEYWDLWTGGKLAAPRAGEPLLVVVKRGYGNAVVPALQAPVKTERLPIEGDWRVAFTPTLDNRWGDYRLPAFTDRIGPEVRAMRWIEEDRVENLGFGPQFFATSCLEPEAKSYPFSWRYGVFDKPGNQDNYHGLNRKVTDLFFVMGPYSQKGYYDMEPPDHDRSLRTTYTTFVHAPADLEARIIAEAEPPWALREDSQTRWEPPSIVSLKVGGEDVRPGARVALKAGYTPVEVQYEGYGRAALVFVATSPSSQADDAVQGLPLSMRWNAMPGRLSYDPFGGKYKTGTFVATVPPGTVDAVVDVRGKLLKKEIRDGILMLEIAFEPGFVGGNAFNDAVKLVTEPAEMALGDWARCEGLRCYSGGATYSKTVEVPAAFRKGAARIVLDLGDVGCAAEVAVNGNMVGTRTCPPWTVDVTDALQDGPNDFAVTVYNTLNNHYQTIPTRYKVTTEKAPSGLLGPVALVADKR